MACAPRFKIAHNPYRWPDHVWSLEESVKLLDPEDRGSGGMKYRIIMWAVAGFLVAGFWTLYFFPTSNLALTRGGFNLARLTCPVVYFPLGIYWEILTNAATYALVGLTVETLRRQLKHAN